MMFDWLERMPVPEGYKTEIVEGAVHFWPQRDVHWHITIEMAVQLGARHTRKRVKSDVRVDYPGHLNGFASDVTLVKAGAVMDERGLWRCADVEFVAEVVSEETTANDYGPKRDAYALAGVPVYLIVDPYTGQCHLFTEPRNGTYRANPAIKFGDPVDLTDTAVGLTLVTEEFPRE
ncbi:Uma2 family endonuclease [Streptomyces sp. NPDC003077]|uniref:Uma2 family endonuclease n=1 Tax=Streptomyces sp. NPDC003077 TaxID=3154443 RepID=UPI0033B06821